MRTIIRNFCHIFLTNCLIGDIKCSYFKPISLFFVQVMLVRRLDGYSQVHFTTVFIPLEISLISLIVTSFYQKGGNQ